MATNTFSNQKIKKFGSLGTLDTVTSDTAAVDVGDLEDVIVNATNYADGSATCTVQINQDPAAANFAPTTASSANSTGYGKSYALTGRALQVRGHVGSLSSGTFVLTYSGWNNNQKRVRTLSLGDWSTTTGAKPALDVSELDKVVVAISGISSATVTVQASYDGSDWITVGSKTSDGSVLVPIPCKLVRCNCTVYSSGTIAARGYGSTSIGKQRFGTLGTFTGTATGTAVDVSDLDKFSVYAQYVDSGTFTAAATVYVEGSLDGTNYAPIGSAFSSAGSVDITGPYKMIRAKCTAFTVGTIDLRFGGENTGLVG
jgi:hypothetical protein